MELEPYRAKVTLKPIQSLDPEPRFSEKLTQARTGCNGKVVGTMMLWVEQRTRAKDETPGLDNSVQSDQDLLRLPQMFEDLVEDDSVESVILYRDCGEIADVVQGCISQCRIRRSPPPHIGRD